MLGKIKNCLLMVVIAWGMFGACSLLHAGPSKNQLINDIRSYYEVFGGKFFMGKNPFFRRTSIEDTTKLNKLLTSITTFVGNEKDNRQRAFDAQSIAGLYKTLISLLNKLSSGVAQSLGKLYLFPKDRAVFQEVEFYASVPQNFKATKDIAGYITSLIRINIADLIPKYQAILDEIDIRITDGRARCYLPACRDKFDVVQALSDSLSNLLRSLSGSLEKMRGEYDAYLTQKQ